MCSFQILTTHRLKYQGWIDPAVNSSLCVQTNKISHGKLQYPSLRMINILKLWKRIPASGRRAWVGRSSAATCLEGAVATASKGPGGLEAYPCLLHLFHSSTKVCLHGHSMPSPCSCVSRAPFYKSVCFCLANSLYPGFPMLVRVVRNPAKPCFVN